MHNFLIFLFLAGLSVLIGGCALPPEKPLEVEFRRASDLAPLTPAPEFESDTQAARSGARGFELRGTGRFTGDLGATSGGWVASESGEFTLNFEAADLREVVKVVLGDLLGANYIISDKVRGQMTLHTERPVERSALLPILESALQLTGNALIASSGGYLVVPLAEAGRFGLVSGDGPGLLGRAGFQLQVVPLRYVSANALRPALEPFLPAGAVLQVNAANNLFLMAGSAEVLGQFVETVQLFDVDWLAGMSFALYPLQRAEASGLVEELRQVFSLDEDGPLKGLIRLLPIERLNAVLLISQRPQYLDDVRSMIARLDQDIGGAGRIMEVYYLQHAKASVVAGTLQQLYSDESEDLELPVSPDLSEPLPLAAADEAGEAPLAVGAGEVGRVQIIGDEDNNALLVMATAADHRVVQRAIRKLDIPRRQVLVEATIAEITLSDNLQYGVQWFLNGAIGGYSTRTSLFSGNSASLPNAVAPGFSFSLTNQAGVVKALFDLLANESKLKVLSSPQVMVIDNQTANIRVGSQIPVITRSSSSVTNPDAPIVNEVQFRDTGVLLQVTPQINAGGTVTLEISQEVSEPSADEFAGGNVAILQRTITSSVVVQSGETVVLGGLIRENETETLTGIPGISKIPLLGKLFSRTVENTSRTELVVTITPFVVTDRSEAREANQELMRRMRSLSGRVISTSATGSATPDEGKTSGF